MDSEIFSGSKNLRMIREFNSSKANSEQFQNTVKVSSDKSKQKIESESEELRLIGTHDISILE